MLKITVPLFVMLQLKTKADKKISLGLNTTRNLHHMTMNATKKAVRDLVWAQFVALGARPLQTPICVTVTLWLPNKANRDLGNFAPVAQKFADDAVVEYGLIKDDGCKYIPLIIYKHGGCDPENPGFDIEYKTTQYQPSKGRRHGSAS